ncbi:Membrane-associated phospholipid phosphatase [Caldanaerobius fijiensis DSM 17918]|uniref:Membrane-associated phospholipid phosphatase n=1 Tax=Caldanaerobius fijiensis DSM 17918 TaxID=1121256 RepID=A0A1M4T422_9THEO|nr:phosphatase PAP2 family protein [Caldanaerobius fijiensis]SHE39226.1 Membrane-associated phospholipid phosphatase [Caldanaerobius fijiensis DSM 17918]
MQVELLKIIQSIHSPIFDVLFVCITYLGSEFFYFAFITYFYWHVNKRFGLKLGLVFLASVYLNTIFKELTAIKRPIGYPGIRSLAVSTAGGYSFPSGHAQHATAFWGIIACYYKSRKWDIIAIALIAAVSFSRLYLGVHWPLDVVGGIAIGLALVYVSLKAERFYYRLSIKKSFNIVCKMMISIVVPVLLLLIFRHHDILIAMGTMSGMLFGYFVEAEYIGYEAGNMQVHTKIITYLLGISGLFIIYIGLSIMPFKTPFFTYMKYFILGVYITLFVPYVYKRITG